ncbi:acyloxyacyl hydrolase [Ruegeria sp. Ofav3-42]|uniref:acyloxyacyl hydrolase n=1 Tax=Ruegeria sp. Ofav3-42 TaxID=2917759 RepID=UPI001EF4F213|nr:acyloxyacyl hydrolase [Ruegeria sp. Ofav3-42]MCG7518655.1 acyloxyacyl hydrolase [Ruegeria sp. Ofav3-42]
MKYFAAIIALLFAAQTAQAQSVVFGAGFSDFSDSLSKDEAVISVEYHHRPFHEATRFSATWGGALTVDTAADFHIGIGLIGTYTFADRWFVEGSVMPGYFSEGDDLNDLGGEFQIRSLLGVGYTLNNGNSVSLAITHKSNASTQDDNPGVNSALLRYHWAF